MDMTWARSEMPRDKFSAGTPEGKTTYEIQEYMEVQRLSATWTRNAPSKQN
jgi:hypothetical protein